MPRQPTKPGWINWITSKSRKVVLHDLTKGILSTDHDNPTAQEVWDTRYKHLQEFIDEEVVFEQFALRLKDHRNQVRLMDERSMWEMAAFEHDRGLFPRVPTNARGETEFDQSEARDLLRQDVKEGMHKTMTAAELRETRDEYKPPLLAVTPRKFKECVRQVSRLQKYYNYRDSKEESESGTWVGAPPPPPPPPPAG